MDIKYPALNKYCAEHGVRYWRTWRAAEQAGVFDEQEMIAACEYKQKNGRYPWARTKMYTELAAFCDEHGMNYTRILQAWYKSHKTLTEQDVVQHLKDTLVNPDAPWQDKAKTRKYTKLAEFAKEHSLNYLAMQKEWQLNHKTLTEDEAIEHYTEVMKNKGSGKKIAWKDTRERREAARMKRSISKPKPKKKGETYGSRKEKLNTYYIERARAVEKTWETNARRERLATEKRESIAPVSISGVVCSEKQGDVFIGKASAEDLARLDALLNTRAKIV